MTRSKYFCDYCEKSFYDDPVNRRRHITGISHQRSKAMWYEAMERNESAYVEPVAVEPAIWCRQYLKNGTCTYGEKCKYRHDKSFDLGSHEQVPGTSDARAHEPAVATLGGSALPTIGVFFGDLPPSLQLPLSSESYSALPAVDWG